MRGNFSTTLFNLPFLQYLQQHFPRIEIEFHNIVQSRLYGTNINFFDFVVASQPSTKK